ncbi:hypothetical protein EPR50_G00125840 [Perca flavescens]|uniref:Cadherin domain-containing protein n=1 Tax=Perca flavescens TaxID=8167 RepID=A0A484CUJ2_PERFV|nr:hypothetical protein EPR50_G00125840 [Perca flavescens]
MFYTTGTVVGKVNATDRDLAGSLHAKIKYCLTTGLDLFAINPKMGVITTITNTLDREAKDKHLVTVVIRDMDGAVNGLSTTGTATITVGDINDNVPIFTKTSPLDYEQNKNVKLEIKACNQAELSGTEAQWMSIPVDVNVLNEDEGPAFSAPTIRFTVKENTPKGTLIGSYIATDPDTKSSNGITYYKLTDPASWITVNRNNGELRVANTIDRESPFVQNGFYNITMKAVDASSKTGTGKVIIVVEDVNDNMPVIPPTEIVLCEKEGELGSVLVVAEDKDQKPFSDPFSFSLPHGHEGKWSLTKVNGTAAMLRHIQELPTGIYHVPIDVTDLQGFGKTQTAKVRICQCRNGACLAKDHSVSLGPLALLAMLLPLLFLLLLGLLLAFFCVTKREKLEFEDVGDSGGILLKSNTESPGEEVDSSLITIPTTGIDQAVKGSVKGVNAGWSGNKSFSTIGGQSTHGNGMHGASGVVTSDTQEYYSGQYDNQFGTQSGQFGMGSAINFDRYLAQDATFLHNWRTNGRYINQKLAYFGTEDGRYADDLIHSYGFEGAGSAAGSVGCCSDFGDNDNLDFLNALGPKFKTLGAVCRKT